MRYLLPFIIVLILSSCLDEADCVTTATNLVKISLRKTNVDSANTVLFSKIAVSGTDSLFYKDDSVSFVSLPLDPRATRTTFLFFYGIETDTLVLDYTQQPTLVSPACGGFIYYSGLSEVFSSFTSITITNPQLSTGATKNIEIKL